MTIDEDTTKMTTTEQVTEPSVDSADVVVGDGQSQEETTVGTDIEKGTEQQEARQTEIDDINVEDKLPGNEDVPPRKKEAEGYKFDEVETTHSFVQENAQEQENEDGQDNDDTKQGEDHLPPREKQEAEGHKFVDIEIEDVEDNQFDDIEQQRQEQEEEQPQEDTSTANNSENINRNANVEFPAAFYCPITKELFRDPVVIPGGVSYERSAIARRGDVPDEKLYPNRALREIVDEQTMMTRRNSFGAGLYRLEKTLRLSMKHIFTEDTEEERSLPDGFYCPITFNLMFEPVIDVEGNTFERVAVEDWIVKNGMSPVTRTPIKIEDLYPNTAIKALLDEEKAKDETSIHPAIRKWRNEKPPERMIRSADIEASTRPYFPSLDDENEAINQRIARYDNVIRCVFASTIITFILFYFVRDNLVMAGIFFFFGFMRWFEYCVQRRRGRPRIYY